MAINTDKIHNLEESIIAGRNTLTAERLDMSFGELMSLYGSNELIIRPEFQRLFRWNIDQRTRFIESLLLGIPVPSIFVAENVDGQWELVDGLQRLSTFISFFGQLKPREFVDFNIEESDDEFLDPCIEDSDTMTSLSQSNSLNNWRMGQGNIINYLEGLSCSDLPVKYQFNLKRCPCRVEIIKWDSKYDMRYELFDRLNRGGSPLTPQELRNCIFRSDPGLTEEIAELAKNQTLRDIVKPSEEKIKQLYLDELVLRFYSLLYHADEVRDVLGADEKLDISETKDGEVSKSKIKQPDYRRKLSDYMTKYMEEASKRPKLRQGKKEKFLAVLSILSQFQDSPLKTRTGQFSTSLYDGVTLGLATYLEFYQSVDGNVILNKIEELKADSEFIKATGTASNYKTRVKTRVERAIAIFKPGEEY